MGNSYINLMLNPSTDPPKSRTFRKNIYGRQWHA